MENLQLSSTIVHVEAYRLFDNHRNQKLPSARRMDPSRNCLKRQKESIFIAFLQRKVHFISLTRMPCRAAILNSQLKPLITVTAVSLD